MDVLWVRAALKSREVSGEHVPLFEERASDLLLEELTQGGHALLQHLLVLQVPDGRHRLPRDHRHQHALLLLDT